MDKLLDFSNLPLGFNTYDGAAEKYTVRFGGHQYLMKFGERLDTDPAKPDQNSYANVPVNEYIGSRLFAAAGIPSQQVMLGVHEGRSVVACRDFIHDLGPNFELLPFKRLETSMPGESSLSKATPDWEFMSKVFDTHPMLRDMREEAWERYRQTICVDALIANFDRHAGNWGFISDKEKMRLIGLAPVYDCGSSLFPRISDEAMARRLNDSREMHDHNLAVPPMTLNVDHKRQRYHTFLLSELAKPFRATLVGLLPKLGKDVTDAVIDEVPGIDDLHRSFYKATLDARRRYILQPAYELGLQERS